MSEIPKVWPVNQVINNPKHPKHPLERVEAATLPSDPEDSVVLSDEGQEALDSNV